MPSAFVAFPARPKDLEAPITAACEGAASEGCNVVAWPQADEAGVHIPQNVRKHIDQMSVLVCDVTTANRNVYYEAGFAMGAGKAVVPIVNISFANADERVRREGLFESISYQQYENSIQLQSILRNLPSSNLVDLYGHEVNVDQPIFLLDSFRKTDFRNAVVSAIKQNKGFYRSFDPVEVPRLSAVGAISEITASSGIVVPILAEHIDDAAVHNLRASFIAGLCHGIGRRVLLLKHVVSDTPDPIDYQDDIVSVRNEDDVYNAVEKFFGSLASPGSIKVGGQVRKKTPIQKLSLGAPAAENEFRTLEDYFVETAEYLRAVRGECAVVAGRKGSGKTAIFFRVRDSLRASRKSSVTDLKPESHQLSLFREQVLKLVDVGVFDHTIAAFWYFLVVSELVLTLRRDLEFASRSDDKALAALEDVDKALARIRANNRGDFTARINRLGQHIIQEIQRLEKMGEKLTPDKLTNVVFREAIGELRQVLLRHTNPETDLWFLFDNIDKGWPATGVSQFDVRMVRLLLEALDKVARDLNVQNRSFTSIVFLRNDILELMVEETPDRGKTGVTRIDWTDRAKLRQLVLRRLEASTGSKGQDFVALWSRFFPTDVSGCDAFEFAVDHSLMRPRFLINILENTVANAINRGHPIAEVEDLIDAVRQHSNYLVDDFGYEIRDVSGITADVLYSFVGKSELLTQGEVKTCLLSSGVEESRVDTAVKLLLWYGVFGVANADDDIRYIWDFSYNQKRLEAEVRRAGPDILYRTNPALHVALAG